ncbi:hypothetical protein, partial [Geofilum rubicundum]|uniref:hypothetical protein n=1 Tax=Geofilum rubicundum TaxID=472113 RepID=UPI001D0ED138
NCFHHLNYSMQNNILPMFCFSAHYETLGISELLHYQGTTTVDARTEDQITTSPPMFYDRVLAQVDYFNLPSNQ